MQQIFMVATFVFVTLLFGMAPVSLIVTATTLAGAILVLQTSNPYWGVRVVGVAGLLLAALACHLGAQLQRKPALLPWLLFGLLAAAIVNAAQGLLQWFGLVGELYRWVVEPEVRGLAFGAFRQRNLFATFLCVGLVAIAWLVHLRRLSEAMAWFLTAVLALALGASGSRTGVLESGAIAIMAVLLRGQLAPAVARLMIGQLGLLGLSMVFLPVAAGWHGFGFSSGASRIAQFGQVAQQGLAAQDLRVIIWDNTLQLIAERPWTGWGWRETGYARFVTLLDNRFDELLEHAHNLPLQLAVEFGLPVALLGCVFVGCLLWRAKPWRIGRGDQHFAWVMLILIVGIHSMLEYPLWSAGFLFITGLCVGYVLPASKEGAGVNSGQAWVLRGAKLGAIGLLVLSLAAWQQYAKVLLIYKTPFTRDLAVQRASINTALTNAKDAWLFQANMDFTSIALMEVNAATARDVRTLAEKLLHHSAEPRVIQPLLLSLWTLNDQVALKFHADRFCRAFPVAFKAWSQQPVPHPMVVEIIKISAECEAVTLEK